LNRRKNGQKEVVEEEVWLNVVVNKGLGPETIPGLLRDVANILLDSKYVTRNLVNERLAYLGWGESVLDETSLQLIILILEKRGLFKFREATLH